MALLNGLVQNPATLQNSDNSQPILSVGRNGDALVSEVHGKYYAAAARGNLFVMSSLIAGVALPVNAATLVSKFTLYNPAGSGKNLELIEFTAGITSATEVVDGILLGWQTGVAAAGVPGTLTSAPTKASTLLGQGLTSIANAYTAATLTNGAVLPEYPLGMAFDATAAGRSGNFVYQFDGKIIVPPDTLVTFMTNIVAETALTCGLTWAEWLA